MFVVYMKEVRKERQEVHIDRQLPPGYYHMNGLLLMIKKLKVSVNSTASLSTLCRVLALKRFVDRARRLHTGQLPESMNTVACYSYFLCKIHDM